MGDTVGLVLGEIVGNWVGTEVVGISVGEVEGVNVGQGPQNPKSSAGCTNGIYQESNNLYEVHIHAIQKYILSFFVYSPPNRAAHCQLPLHPQSKRQHHLCQAAPHKSLLDHSFQGDHQ